MEAVALALILVAEPAIVGDPAQGARVYRAECAACHGAEGLAPTALGAKLKASSLRDPAQQLPFDNERLADLIGHGIDGTGMPGFGRDLSVLEIYDLVAWMRQGLPHLADYFPAAGQYLAKPFTLDKPALERISAIVGPLAENETTTMVATLFAPDGALPTEGPEYVPPDPIRLDTLSPKRKLGYVIYVPIAMGGQTQLVGFGLGADLVIKKLTVANGNPKTRAASERELAPFIGEGGRQKLKSALTSRGRASPALTKTMARAYLRAAESAVMYDKDESARHVFDDEPATPKAADAPKAADIKVHR